MERRAVGPTRERKCKCFNRLQGLADCGSRNQTRLLVENASRTEQKMDGLSSRCTSV
nr:MAG TPA: hypothetical protein [Caudoviricetes sp.]